MRLGLIMAVVMLLLPTVVSPVGAAEPEGAKQIVETLHSGLLDVMRNADKLGYQGRFDKLAPALKASYDFSEMARIASGSFWKSSSPEQKTKLADTHMRMSVATYAMRLDGYSGERFETLSVDPLPTQDVMVRTRIVNPDGKETALTYQLRPREQGWRIIDVYLNGSISELAVRRSEYLSILGASGVDGLVTQFEQKIAGMAKKSAAGGGK